jgi:hypothetical protein
MLLLLVVDLEMFRASPLDIGLTKRRGKNVTMKKKHPPIAVFGVFASSLPIKTRLDASIPVTCFQGIKIIERHSRHGMAQTSGMASAKVDEITRSE